MGGLSSETVIEFIILSGQKIGSRILLFRVGSVTYWVKKVWLVRAPWIKARPVYIR